MKTINVEIKEDGTVVVQAVGFKGKACELATAAIEQALGKITSKRKTPEWYQNETVVQKTRC
jgi:NifU-like protein involved in Fe-S cluster formation